MQRQILYRTEDLAQPKVEVARAALGHLNPDVHVNAHHTRLTEANADTLIAEYDFVADGCDNFETRFAVADACLEMKKTLVSAAVGRFEAQLSTFKPHEKMPDGEAYPCYRCLVPEAPPKGPCRRAPKPA